MKSLKHIYRKYLSNCYNGREPNHDNDGMQMKKKNYLKPFWYLFLSSMPLFDIMREFIAAIKYYGRQDML